MYKSERFRSITRNICGKQFVNTSGDLHSEVVSHIIEEGDDLTDLNDPVHYFAYHAVRLIRRDYNIAKKYNINSSNHHRKVDNESTLFGSKNYRLELRKLTFLSGNPDFHKEVFLKNSCDIDTSIMKVKINADEEYYSKKHYDQFLLKVDEILSTEPKDIKEDFKRKLWKIYEIKKSYREVKKELPTVPARLINETLQEFKNDVLKQLRDI